MAAGLPTCQDYKEAGLEGGDNLWVPAKRADGKENEWC
jgi:hypothetical protein